MDNNKKRNPSAGTKNPLICALIGGGISIAVIAVTMLLFPFVALKFSDPKSAVLPICIICALIGGLAGGFISAKICGDFMIHVGLMSAGITAVTLLLISLVTIGKINFALASVIILAIVLSSLLGSYLVMQINRKSKRNMKKVLRRR